MNTFQAPFFDRIINKTKFLNLHMLEKSIEKELNYMMNTKSHLLMSDFAYILENDLPCPSNILGVSSELIYELVKSKEIKKLESIFEKLIPRFDSRIITAKVTINNVENNINMKCEAKIMSTTKHLNLNLKHKIF